MDLKFPNQHPCQTAGGQQHRTSEQELALQRLNRWAEHVDQKKTPEKIIRTGNVKDIP